MTTEIILSAFWDYSFIYFKGSLFEYSKIDTHYSWVDFQILYTDRKGII